MGVRIWIDDQRDMPDGYDWWCRHFSGFRELLDHFQTQGVKVSLVSFDYVLLGDPAWPRPHEKHGDACVEIFSYFQDLHAPDLEVEFHSSEEKYNDKMRTVWEHAQAFHRS